MTVPCRSAGVLESSSLVARLLWVFPGHRVPCHCCVWPLDIHGRMLVEPLATCHCQLEPRVLGNEVRDDPLVHCHELLVLLDRCSMCTKSVDSIVPSLTSFFIGFS